MPGQCPNDWAAPINRPCEAPVQCHTPARRLAVCLNGGAGGGGRGAEKVYGAAQGSRARGRPPERSGATGPGGSARCSAVGKAGGARWDGLPTAVLQGGGSHSGWRGPKKSSTGPFSRLGFFRAVDLQESQQRGLLREDELRRRADAIQQGHRQPQNAGARPELHRRPAAADLRRVGGAHEGTRDEECPPPPPALQAGQTFVEIARGQPEGSRKGAVPVKFQRQRAGRPFWRHGWTSARLCHSSWSARPHCIWGCSLAQMLRAAWQRRGGPYCLL